MVVFQSIGALMVAAGLCAGVVAAAGEAGAVEICGAEKQWDHDAFLVYADRWMYEDDTKFIRIVKAERGTDYDNDWSRQGMVWDPFVKAMWTRCRLTVDGPIDRWKQGKPS